MANAAESHKHEVFQPMVDSQRDLLLTFFLNNEDLWYCHNDYVTEIIGIQKITEVPDMSDEIKGVINLRGRVIPVMDVCLRFGLPSRDYDERTYAVLQLRQK